MINKYRICTRCVMDTTDIQIRFDKNGMCNHCEEYDNVTKRENYTDKNTVRKRKALIEEIKESGKGKSYNCIIGLSGGVDSTYLAYVVKREFDLNPLAVHLDNGWDSKLAVKNIQNIVRKLDIDLHTHVIDWEEFKDLQIAYLKASVLDIEVLTDHAIIASLYNIADENDVKYILTGSNWATEKILPKSWTFNKNDLKNIKSIHKKFGKREIKTFPTLGLQKLRYFTKVKKIRSYSPLNYIRYNKIEAKKIIMKELGWVDYGGKHYESIFTRFYQGYILPGKFNIDKRKAHLSTLICSGQITREEALEELKKPTYDKELIQQDYEYVVKKFDLTKEGFEELMAQPVISHFEYATDWRSKLIKKYISPTNPLLRLKIKYM